MFCFHLSDKYENMQKLHMEPTLNAQRRSAIFFIEPSDLNKTQNRIDTLKGYDFMTKCSALYLSKSTLKLSVTVETHLP